MKKGRRFIRSKLELSLQVDLFRPLMKLKNILLITVGLVIFISPIIIYMWYFNQSEISTNAEAWGVFGDFVGGVMNPLLSLANLGVLGYLTYLIAKQSNEENRKRALHDKRMIAYDRLCEHAAAINSFNYKLRIIPKVNPNEKSVEGLAEHVSELLNEMRKVAHFYIDLSSFLREFNVRYSHLFDYDFKSKVYLQLIKDCELVFEYFISKVDSNDEEVTSGAPPLKQFADKMTDFINAIRNEVIEKGKD
jgi:hypothetical protein